MEEFKEDYENKDDSTKALFCFICALNALGRTFVVRITCGFELVFAYDINHTHTICWWFSGNSQFLLFIYGFLHADALFNGEGY